MRGQEKATKKLSAENWRKSETKTVRVVLHLRDDPFLDERQENLIGRNVQTDENRFLGFGAEFLRQSVGADVIVGAE